MNTKKEKNGVAGSVASLIKEIADFLTLVFCVLRACDVIDWNWYFVMMPTFVRSGVGVIAFCIAGMLAGVALNSKDE